VQYPGIRRVQVLDGERRYSHATGAADAATTLVGAGPLGSLLILVKRDVDTLVIDYVNARGGSAAIALQLPKGEGIRCARLLQTHGVVVELPPPQSEAPQTDPQQK
jgi:hypothetical protein